jgi:hypothetical protein
MRSQKHIALSVALCVVVTVGTVGVIRGFSYFKEIYEDYRGYDYDSKIAKQYDWIGPKPGEVIDTDKLVNTEGVSLDKLPKAGLMLLTVVEPECAASKESDEQMRFLSEKLTGRNIDYFLVCFSRKVSAESLSGFVDSLNLQAKSFSWNDDFENVLPSIKSIVYPSHILIDSKGVVIKTFPGTSSDRSIRDRMVRQVLKEVLEQSERRTSIE